MLLVFGGTTEGRRAVEVLEEAGSPYYYSTKTGEQELSLHNGQHVDGALDGEGMTAFVKAHAIRLIVDAAHPFAMQLHQTIADVAAECRIPVVRYERIYPPRDPDITWIDDYSQVPTDIHTLLATTGVQSISKLKWLEAEGIKVYYRILPRESSIALAHQQGATDEQLCFYELNHGDRPHDLRYAAITGVRPHDSADAILLKESGLSGGFTEKVEAAREKGMRIIALKRPEPSPCVTSSCVNGPYGLRRAVEKLLPEFFPLHSGLTTGTCATAAAVADTMRLLKGETPAEVPVVLPDGETIHVPVIYGSGYAACIKEAGDDPDVTNGIEVRAAVEPIVGGNLQSPTDEGRICNSQLPQIEILGGEGVGTITLPGFDYPPGSPAINKAPCEMIRQNVLDIVRHVNHGDRPHDLRYATITGVSPHDSLRVTISVPKGAEIARRTFNPRLGIEGGISIIGVSGIVKPFSEEAFIDSIRKCMTIAQASGSDCVVINSGGKSERFVKALYPELPQQAFVEYGNYIGATLRIAHELGILNITLGVMIGKAVKLAQGHLDTHSKKATMDRIFISQMLQEADVRIDVSKITLARELWEKLPKEKIQDFVDVVIRHCSDYCRPLLPNGQLTILLIDDNGNIYQ